MTTAQWILLIVGIVLVLALIAFLVGNAKKKQRLNQRAESREVRREADDHAIAVKERESAAAQTQAQAERARAEAEEKAREAEELERQHGRRTSDLDEARGQHDSTLRRADDLDPDVKTDSDGNRLDGSDPGERGQGGIAGGSTKA